MGESMGCIILYVEHAGISRVRKIELPGYSSSLDYTYLPKTTDMQLCAPQFTVQQGKFRMYMMELVNYMRSHADCMKWMSARVRVLV